MCVCMCVLKLRESVVYLPIVYLQPSNLTTHVFLRSGGEVREGVLAGCCSGHAPFSSTPAGLMTVVKCIVHVQFL